MIKLTDILNEIKVVPGGNMDITSFLNNNYKKFIKEFGDPKTKFDTTVNTAEDGSRYEVAYAGVDEDYGIDVSFSYKFMELSDIYNDIEEVIFLGRKIYVNNYLNSEPEEDEEDLDEIKVVPGGVRGIYILKTIWDGDRECNVSVDVFRTEKEAQDAALTNIWEHMDDNEDTELSEKEFLNTYSFKDYIDGTIGYKEPRYEIEKAQ
jgi:hypothetical protein